MARGRVTILDVSREAGVSRSTVSLVLRGEGSISQATQQRVWDVIERIGYVYHRGAASLRDTESKILGVIVPDFANSTFGEIAAGIETVSQSRGYVQFMAQAGDDPDRQAKIISAMGEYGIAGLVVAPAIGTTPDQLRVLDRFDIPMVQVGRRLDEESLNRVVSDDRTGIQLAVHHLYAHGHRDIAFLGGDENTVAHRVRAAVFVETVSGLGLPLSDPPVLTSRPSAAGGLDALHQLHASGRRPTAIVCFNDAVALGVYDGLHDAGLEPGVDVSVIGFDDAPEAAHTFPKLTTISVDPRGLGQTAASLMIDLIHGDVDAPQHITCPVHLVVRDSVRPVTRAGS